MTTAINTVKNINIQGVAATGSTTAVNSTSWSNMTINTGDIRPASIQIKGDAVFEGNITWQGRDMREWFASVEARIGILQPNPELEKDWEQLHQLRMQYVELERKLLEKQRIFDILKKP